MFWRKLFGVLAAIVMVVTIPTALLLSNLYLLATPAFLKNEYSKPGFPSAPGFTDAERLQQAEATLQYVRSQQSIEVLQKLHQKGEPLYNARELIHLADVQRVMYWAFTIHWVALALLLMAIVYILLQPSQRVHLPVYVFWGSVVLAVPILVIGVFAAVNFDLFFVIFHRLFFAGDSWIFPGSDSLIRLFPLPFWMDAALTWGVLAFGEAVVVGAAAYLWPGWRHKR